VQKGIQGKGLQDVFWFSRGFDCPDAECRNAFGELIPKPFEKVGEWMTSAPYRSHAWRPLDVELVLRIMHGENGMVQNLWTVSELNRPLRSGRKRSPRSDFVFRWKDAEAKTMASLY
jgi:hypothetical protein